MNLDLSNLSIDVTAIELIQLASSILVGLIVAFVVRFGCNRIKSKLLSRSRNSVGGHILNDVDGALSLWIIASGIYTGVLGISSISEYFSVMRNIFVILSIVILTYSGIRVQGDLLSWSIRKLGRRTGQTKALNSLLPMAKRIASIIIMSMGALMVLDQMGIAIAPLVAGLGIGGLAVALALQGTLTNFFAGLNVITDGSIRVGDFVQLEGELIGEVDQIGWRTTRIRLLSDNMVIMPNAKLAESLATNYSRPADAMSVYVQVGVSYFSDLDQVERVTIDVAKTVLANTQGAIVDYEPSVWFSDFGDSNINFWVVLRCSGYMESWTVRHNFVRELFKRYKQEGIEISFPARNFFMRSE